MRERADRAGHHPDADTFARPPHTLDAPLQVGVPQRQLQAKGHHLGVDAVGAADHRRVLVLVGARLDRLAERRHVLEDQVAGLDHLQGLRGVDHVGRGQAEVQPPGGRPDDFRHGRRERNHVVLRRLFDLVDARDVERALVAQLARRFGRHDAGGSHRFGRRDFHLEPGLVAALLAPDATHLWVRVPRNQSASCSCVTCRPLTLPRTVTASDPLVKNRSASLSTSASVTFSIAASISSRPKV